METHVYRYTWAAAYMKRGEPAFSPWRVTERETYLSRRRGDERGVLGWPTVESEQLDVRTKLSQQRLGYETGIQEGDLESPFLGELFFTHEVDGVQARTDRIWRESPFGDELGAMGAGDVSAEAPEHFAAEEATETESSLDEWSDAGEEALPKSTAYSFG